MEPQSLVAALDRELRDRRLPLKRAEAYYHGEQPIRFMAPVLEAEVGDRIAPLVINWPKLCADAYDERSDVTGFRYAGQESGDETLWELWQANDGDEQSQQAHIESLKGGCSYVIVGAGDSPDDAPVMTVEHGLQVGVRRDPRTRRVSAAIKRWQDEEHKHQAALYLPEATIYFVREGRGWIETDRSHHNLGVVPVVPIVNDPQILRPDGRSQFQDITPVADAANKMATDMMVSGEFHAIPRRWAVGVSEKDFVDEHGKQLDTWSAIAGRLWASENTEVKYGQFPEADLSNFHNTIKLLAQLCCQLEGLPQDYMSFTSDNPTSADALRAAEARFVKRVTRKQTTWGGSWEQVLRLMLAFQTGRWDPKARAMETLWVDAATPTKAQQADATVKLVQAKVIPVEQAREDLGYSPEQRKRMAAQDAEETDRGLLGTLADEFRRPAPEPAGGAAT